MAKPRVDELTDADILHAITTKLTVHPVVAAHRPRARNFQKRDV